MFAAEDDFEITIQGKGGHAALPHRAINATLVAAEVVVALQTLVSREVDPLDLAVVTVGMLRSGVAGNVIADRAELAGSVRTFDPEVRDYLEQKNPGTRNRRRDRACVRRSRSTTSMVIQQSITIRR